MNPITESVKDFLEYEEILFEQVENTGVFKFEFTGESATFRGRIEVDEEHRSVHVRMVAPAKAPASKRASIAELLARINHGILLGNFDLDLQTGVIVFRTSLVLGASPLHGDVIEALVYVAWCAMDAFFPAITMVLFSDISPKEAADRIKLQRPDEPDNTHLDESLRERLKDILRGSRN